MNRTKKKDKVALNGMLLLIAALLAMTLAGCSGEDTEEQTSPAPTAAQTATPTAKATEPPTQAPTEAPTKAPVAKTVEISVKDHASLVAVFGSTQIVSTDAGVPMKCIKLMQAQADLDDDEFYKSGAAITLNASEACSATVFVTLACPDAINGARGYSLLYSVNQGPEDAKLDPEILALDNEASEPLQTLQEFEFEIELEKGENKLYLFQSTANNSGAWRISVTSLRLELSAGDITLP